MLRLHPWWVCGLCVATLSIIAVGVESWPKATPLSLNPNVFVGYYWGGGLLGKHFYRVVANEGLYGHWEVAFRGNPGYYAYRGYYPDGTIREEGEIYVGLSGLPLEPIPNTSDVKWGNYYTPDGKLGSQVRDGTGEQKFWYPNGKLRWRLVLRDHRMVLDETWLDDGKLFSKERYGDSGQVTRVEKGISGKEKKTEKVGVGKGDRVGQGDITDSKE